MGVVVVVVVAVGVVVLLDGMTSTSPSLSSLCLFFLLLLIELSLLLGCGILVLLVLGYQIVHVRLGFSKLHLIHSLAGVPMEEGLTPEHGRKLLRDPLEQLLNGGRVPDERGRHLEAAWRDVADRRLHVVRDPLDEVATVLVLDVQHLFVDLYMDI